MSLSAFKKKSIIQYGTRRSNTNTNTNWIPTGPYGNSTTFLSLCINSIGPGFSINGGHRNIGYVAKSSVFSKNFTPYKGKYAKGNGGFHGQYYNREHIYPSQQTETLGNQYAYIKPSVVSTYGLLDKKYRWAYYGVYPNNIVNPSGNGNSNLSDNTSQGVYIKNISSANSCIDDINNTDKYLDYYKTGGPYLCYKTNGDRFTYDKASSNGPYTKTIKVPITASQQILRLQRKCLNNSIIHIPGNKSSNSVCGIPL